MSVNLTKHKTALLTAWKDVVDEKSATDWALFGYEKQSNDLYVVGTGDGGLEELVDELNSGKVMYAFCKVTCPNTGLLKFVFINWQGEGAPLNRKGACANHVLDISNFFKGSHVTINARMEEDVEPSLILEKVSKASASKFNFKDRSDPVENMTPVGSVYKRIMPTREINPVEREKFWIKEQEEEKRRIIEEKKKAEEERKKLEEERKEREKKDSVAREEWVKERSQSINKMREAEKNADNVARNIAEEKKLWERQLEDDAKDEKARRTRSENLRRERSHEAQTLISKRTINARAIFEQNTCAGQMTSVQTSRQPKILQEFEENQAKYEVHPSSPVPASSVNYNSPTVEHISVEDLEKEKDQKVEITSAASPPEEFNYTRNLLKEPPRQDSELELNAEEEQNWDEPTLEAPPNVRDPLTEMMAEHGIVRQTVDNTQVITSSPLSDGLKARALYDYQAADDTEISFDPDDIITHIEQIDEGWWQGLAPDGSWGLFPANYVELLE
ncbi:drebrin-like protein [Trichonephila inaurata madagascariensis]|uniref:Drebrin-like protein n=1 Tax=Trichonephila inaurata madagascariensis TaxID=2747483 RepID=A0A8X6WR25_9ARAC|nr:drebrin-like protein [Trichonephila inaurata madagascariensis]